MKISEILNNKLRRIKRGKTFTDGENFYTFYDFEISSDMMGRTSYLVSRRMFLKLDKNNKDFEILDKTYSDVFFKKGRFMKIKSSFNIYKKKLIDKFKEKYGEEYLLKVFNHTNNEIVSDIVDYVDNSLFNKHKMLFFDNKLYIFSPNNLNKDVYMERVYKLKKLQNKLVD
ncbi:MAG: hypothetical protein ACOC3Z_01655 [Nanoarchaeota archaeon]